MDGHPNSKYRKQPHAQYNSPSIMVSEHHPHTINSGQSRSRTRLLRADAARRVAEAGAEQPVEMRDVGKSRLPGDLGNRAAVVMLPAQQRERPLQPQLVDARGERHAGFLEQ